MEDSGKVLSESGEKRRLPRRVASSSLTCQGTVPAAGDSERKGHLSPVLRHPAAQGTRPDEKINAY